MVIKTIVFLCLSIKAMGQVQQIVIRKTNIQNKLCGRWLLDRDSFYVKDTSINSMNDVFFDFYPDGRYYYKPHPVNREYGRWKTTDKSLFTYDRKVYGNIKENGVFSTPQVRVFADSQSYILQDSGRKLILMKGSTVMKFKKIKSKG